MIGPPLHLDRRPEGRLLMTLDELNACRKRLMENIDQ
jgi:hypothetical protein